MPKSSLLFRLEVGVVEPYSLSMTEMIARIRRRRLSPVALMESVLARIDSLEPRIQAWVTIDRKAILEEARRTQDEISRGKLRGPLHGIPIGVKDIFYTAGMKTTAGSKIFENFIPSYDSTAVQRLKQAGAIILGKTATTEFAQLDPAPTRNPWNPDHTPGGSSSGSAAAVAVAMCPAALGSQTGGSVLRPAAYCGVVGLKPTYGRISRHGVIACSWTLDHVGILARSVTDAAILLGVLAGHDLRADEHPDRHPHAARRLDHRGRLGSIRGRNRRGCAMVLHVFPPRGKLLPAGPPGLHGPTSVVTFQELRAPARVRSKIPRTTGSTPRLRSMPISKRLTRSSRPRRVVTRRASEPGAAHRTLSVAANQ